ncbi:MAG: chorismate synthase, partial [Bacteroidales bacterium]|nr:chorismate synthase [Bacteroidales bacterium]
MNTIGTIFKTSIFGESHGNGIGVVMDGVPAGISLTVDDFIADLSRRKAGAKGTTPRKEDDLPEILSGVFNGKTTGAPLAVLFRNGNTKSKDYSQLFDHPRPGHADFVARVKYGGFNDYAGGGHFSGRITLGLVAAGVVAKKILSPVSINANILEIGGSTDFD